MIEITTLFWIALSCFLTSIISSIAGFGGGFIIIAVFLFFFDTKEAVALSSLIFIWTNAGKWWFNRTTIDWSFLKPVLVGMIPGVLIGLLLFNRVEGVWIRYYLAFLAFYIIVEHFWKKLPSIKHFSIPILLSSGFSWGLLSGLSNAGGVKVMLLKWRGLSKHIFVGTSGVMSLCIEFFKAPSYYKMGYLSFDIAWKIFLLAGITVLCGSYLGKKVVDCISHTVFEWIVLIMLGVATLRLLFF